MQFTCLTTAVLGGICQPGDLKCICGNPVFTANMTGCVSSTCTIKESLTTENFTQTTCQTPVRNRSKEASYTAVGGAILALVAVTLRLISKLPVLGGGFGADDATLIVAMVCNCTKRKSKIADRTIRFLLEHCRLWLLSVSSILQASHKGSEPSDSWLTLPVTHDGLGRDIWTVPFAKLTHMLYVSRLIHYSVLNSKTLTASRYTTSKS